MDLLLKDVPESIDKALKQRATARGTTAAVEAVAVLNSALVPLATEPTTIGSSLDWFFGSEPLEQSVLDAIAEADVVHPDDMK